MKILALDSSSNVASAALMDNGVLLGEYSINYKQTHSQTLLPMIDTLLKAVETDVEAVDLFAAANGPGSLTGLRIGLATVKGLAHACNKDVYKRQGEGYAVTGPCTKELSAPIDTLLWFKKVSGE